MRHNQNEYTKFTQDKLGVVGLSYQNWLCRNTNARLFFTSKCCDMSNQVKRLNAAGLNNFLLINDLDKKDYSQKRFKKALEEACEKFDYKLDGRKNQQSRLPEYKIIK